MRRCKDKQKQETQLVLPIERGNDAGLPKFEPAIRHELSQLLRILIAECTAPETTREVGEDE